jgi:hypothetical protein
MQYGRSLVYGLWIEAYKSSSCQHICCVDAVFACLPAAGQPTSNDGSSSASGVAQQQYQQYSQGAWSLAQKVSSGSHIQHAVAMTYLPGAPDW